MSYKLSALNVGPLLPPSAGTDVMELCHSFNSAEYGLCRIPIIVVFNLMVIKVEMCF